MGPLYPPSFHPLERTDGWCLRRLRDASLHETSDGAFGLSSANGDLRFAMAKNTVRVEGCRRGGRARWPVVYSQPRGAGRTVSDCLRSRRTAISIAPNAATYRNIARPLCLGPPADARRGPKGPTMTPPLRQAGRAEECFDTVIIGAGPAGLAAAARLVRSGVAFVLIEAGEGIAARTLALNPSPASGVGGAGLYSDGKFSFFPSASELWTLDDHGSLQEAYSWLTALLRDFGLESPPLPPPGASPGPVDSSGFKPYPSFRLAPPARDELTRRLSRAVEENLRPNSRVISIRQENEGFTIFVDTPAGVRTFSARTIIFGAGRYGPLELQRVFPEIPMIYRRFEIGIRIEQPSDIFLLRDHPGLDVKYILPAEGMHAEWRTFCTCRNGIVIPADWAGYRSVSGHSDSTHSNLSNCGYNLRLLQPPEDANVAEELWSLVNGRVAPFAVDARRFLSPSRVFLGATLDAAFRSRLGTLLPPESIPRTTIHGPTVEGVGYYPDINASLKVHSNEIWIAGDATGRFRGLTAALVSGFYCAEKVVQYLALAQQGIPFFVKQSPSTSMRTVFTAQSKAFFYCRDAVCEFAFKQGVLPLNPFRVFGYFLGDRVDRDRIRQGNNQLVTMAEELWVFGPVSDGVLFEIVRARSLRKPVRFFGISSKPDEIAPIAPADVRFEPEVHARQITREDLLALLADRLPTRDAPPAFVQLSLELG